MPDATWLSDAAYNIEADALGRALDGGYLRIYSEKGKQLAELRFSAPAFRAAVGGEITANPIASDPKAAGGGKPDNFIVWTREGAKVLGGKIGEAMSLSMDYISEGSEVNVSIFIHRVKPKE